MVRAPSRTHLLSIQCQCKLISLRKTLQREQFAQNMFCMQERTKGYNTGYLVTIMQKDLKRTNRLLE